MPKKPVVPEEAKPEVEAGLRRLVADFPGIRDDYAALFNLIAKFPGHGNRFVDEDKTYHEDMRYEFIQSRDWPENDRAGVFVYTVRDQGDCWSFTPIAVSSGARWNGEGEVAARKLLGLPEA